MSAMSRASGRIKFRSGAKRAQLTIDADPDLDRVRRRQGFTIDDSRPNGAETVAALLADSWPIVRFVWDTDVIDDRITANMIQRIFLANAAGRS